MGVHQTFGESQTHQIPIFASISPLDFSEDFFTQKAMKWYVFFLLSLTDLLLHVKISHHLWYVGILGPYFLL